MNMSTCIRETRLNGKKLEINSINCVNKRGHLSNEVIIKNLSDWQKLIAVVPKSFNLEIKKFLEDFKVLS